MIKTFILDAEYDESELIDVVICEKDPLYIKLAGSKTPISTALIEIRNDKSYTSFICHDCTIFQIPTEFYIPGLLQVTVSELIDGTPVKTWTVPPVLLHELTDRFSGHDVIAKILDTLPKIESISAALTNLTEGFKNLTKLVDDINTIVYDPLNIN